VRSTGIGERSFGAGYEFEGVGGVDGVVLEGVY
jgi:hypothetical protein